MRVIIESPYSNKNGKTVQENVAYARECLLDSLERDEQPIASHLLYTQVLDDNSPTERTLGINAGLAWQDAASKVIFYIDNGFSEGMVKAMELCLTTKKPYEFRKIKESGKTVSGFNFFETDFQRIVENNEKQIIDFLLVNNKILRGNK